MKVWHGTGPDSFADVFVILFWLGVVLLIPLGIVLKKRGRMRRTGRQKPPPSCNESRDQGAGK